MSEPAIPWRPRNRERASGREEPDDAELLPDRDSTPAALSPRSSAAHWQGRGRYPPPASGQLSPPVGEIQRRRQNIFAFSETGVGGENI